MFMVEPITDTANQWVADNVQIEPWQWLGCRFSVDHHFIENLVEDMENDGLELGNDFNVIHC